MKSQKTLEAFTAYCKANPEQRFWQALNNWYGSQAILIMSQTGQSVSEMVPEAIERANNAMEYHRIEDMYYEE